MPIVVSESSQYDPFFERLKRAGVTTETMTPEREVRERPLRIGILNLMPAAAMETTEAQWLRYMSRTALDIEPVLLKFDDDQREHDRSSRKSILARYAAFTKVAETGLDGLIVTGDNLELKHVAADKPPELLPFGDINYAAKLKEVVNWARQEVTSTVYSCLASHFVLNYLFDIERDIRDSKLSGVYEHRIDPGSPSDFTNNMDDLIRAPHSR